MNEPGDKISANELISAGEETALARFNGHMPTGALAVIDFTADRWSKIERAGGASITATISNAPGRTGDWVGFFPSVSGPYVEWHYLNGQQAKPVSAIINGAVQFTAPNTSGIATFWNTRSRT